MNACRIGAIAVSVACLSGCASDFSRSYERWRSYDEMAGPFQPWARCVEERSFHYLDHETSTVTDAHPIRATRAQLFARVLGDCSGRMSGAAWADLDDRAMRQKLADAWQAFTVAEAEIVARDAAAIVSESD